MAPEPSAGPRHHLPPLHNVRVVVLQKCFGELGFVVKILTRSTRTIMRGFYLAPRILTALSVFPLICGISSKWA